MGREMGQAGDVDRAVGQVVSHVVGQMGRVGQGLSQVVCVMRRVKLSSDAGGGAAAVGLLCKVMSRARRQQQGYWHICMNAFAARCD